MNSFFIKFFAIILMILAHFDYFFSLNSELLLALGRISFPLFAWLIANGAYHTKNIKHYIIRLTIFAFISQMPFILANWEINSEYWKLNILFTLLFGLIGILLIKKLKSFPLKFLLIFLILVCAYFLRVDYGPVGVALVVLSYLFFKSFWKMALSQFLLFGLPAILNIYILIQKGNTMDFNSLLLYFPSQLLSLVFIYFYNSKEGFRLKYLFYVFYPLHYLVIYLIIR